MAEYIEREAVLMYAKMFVHIAYSRGNPLRDEEIEKAVNEIPAADVAPVRHGRWTLIEYPYGQKTYICSECNDDDWWQGRYAYGDERYCPNCGAKMDGGET